MKNSCICLMSALGGAIIGAAVAMLTTPQSGKELRGKIRDSFNEATECVREGLEEMRPCHCNDEHK
ncbi:MAG: YtxH domain-containing protein [Alistipes sp.]|nr:YtxH domain-containing protein [Alistipes sp.]